MVVLIHVSLAASGGQRHDAGFEFAYHAIIAGELQVIE